MTVTRLTCNNTSREEKMVIAVLVTLGFLLAIFAVGALFLAARQ